MLREQINMNITFGKYKNQDLAIVYADKDYKRWLLKQDFFKEKFPEHYEFLKILFDGEGPCKL